MPISEDIKKRVVIKRDKLGRFVGWGGQIKKCGTCSKKFYGSFSRIKDNRGKFYSMRCRRNSFLKRSKEYVLNENMAELIGIIIGDGCISRCYRSNVFRIFISGNPVEDEDYFKNYLPNLVEICLGKRPSIYFGKNGAIIVQFSNESFRLFLHRLGIRERKTKTVRIPTQIQRKKKLLIRCIRGIADTDFTLIFKKSHSIKHNYPRICGHFASFRLVKDLEKALRSLDFTLNTTYKMERYDKRGLTITTNYINLDGHNNLKRWLELIGFSNLRILSRYLVWQKYGYLNPRTTLPQRLELIQAGGGV